MQFNRPSSICRNFVVSARLIEPEFPLVHYSKSLGIHARVIAVKIEFILCANLLKKQIELNLMLDTNVKIMNYFSYTKLSVTFKDRMSNKWS